MFDCGILLLVLCVCVFDCLFDCGVLLYDVCTCLFDRSHVCANRDYVFVVLCCVV